MSGSPSRQRQQIIEYTSLIVILYDDEGIFSPRILGQRDFVQDLLTKYEISPTNNCVRIFVGK